MFTRLRNHTRLATPATALLGALIVTLGLAAPGVASADESPPISLPPGVVIASPTGPSISLPPITIPPTTAPEITVPIDVSIPPTTEPVITLPTDVTIVPTTDGPTTTVPTTAPITVPGTDPVQLPPPPPGPTPSKPLNLTATPGVDSIKLAWQAPVSNGGSALLYYRVRVYSANCAAKLSEFATWASSVTVSVPDGGARCFFVNAVNAAGSGATSNVAKATAGRPLAPATCSITFYPNGDYIQVVWSATGSWGGYASTGYHILFTDADGFENDIIVAQNQTNAVWVEPAAGQWHAEVWATNVEGGGPACTTGSVTVN